MANMGKNAQYHLMDQVRNGHFDSDDYSRRGGKQHRKPRKRLLDSESKGTPKYGVREFCK